MPATFPSHAAAVLPLKVWRPRWFDGVALVIGSTAPDLGYPLEGFVEVPGTHWPPGLLHWCLPVTLALCWLVRRYAADVAVHLPGRWFALPDYGALARVRHRWYVTVWSALLGAGSHLFWDGFTHNPEIGGWAVRHIPVLSREAAPGGPWWYLLQPVSTVLGGLVAVGLLAHIAALARIKAAAAHVNAALGVVPHDVADAIDTAAAEVEAGRYDRDFPIDVFQTGSGTSSNMNMNEVLATLAARRLGRPVHPNDEVNASQSSNDVFPSSIHLAATEAVTTGLLPALEHLASTLDGQA